MFICVGTPAGDNGCADLKYLRREAGDVGRYMQDYKIVVDKSTVPVGTADMVAEIIQGELSRRGVGLEFDVVSNPEFLMNDMREAPSLELIRELTGRGMKIRAYDPEAGENAREMLKDNSLVEVVDRQYKVLSGADCLAVVTEWNQFRNPDFESIGKELAEPVIFDGRNLYRPEILSGMGLCCFSIGRPAEKVDWEAEGGIARVS